MSDWKDEEKTKLFKFCLSFCTLGLGHPQNDIREHSSRWLVDWLYKNGKKDKLVPNPLTQYLATEGQWQ